MRAIAEAGGPADFVYDPENFLLRRPETFANLGNTYQAYQAARGELRERVLHNFAAAFSSSSSDIPTNFDEVRDKLVAVVREQFFLNVTRGGQIWQLPAPTDTKSHAVSEPLTRWFAKALVIDFPTHVMVVNESHLKDWGVTFDEAFALGLERLKDATMPKFRHEGGVYAGTWNDDFDSSRVLIPSLFDDLPLKGDPVVCLPNRLTLLVAGSDEPEAIKAMLQQAEEIVRTVAKPQNPAPLVIRDGYVFDYEVEPDSPVFQAVQRARGVAALAVYDEQKANLERIYKENGKDLYVAEFILGQDKDGKYTSHAVWSKGVRMLLPRADVVMFFDEEKAEPERVLAHVPWSRVEAVMGEAMLDTKMFPERYFVSDFPSEEQLERLR
ncbi:MAG: hypothetical protein V4773_04410 [Verrucomicrobiota bacterium]